MAGVSSFHELILATRPPPRIGTRVRLPALGVQRRACLRGPSLAVQARRMYTRGGHHDQLRLWFCVRRRPRNPGGYA